MFNDRWHMDLQQQSRLTAGQIHEARNEPEKALAYYQAILEDGSSFGGEVVQDAKDRIDALRSLGVH